ncbi:MAG: M15 family metallopeptidase [Sarcina sp.]
MIKKIQKTIFYFISVSVLVYMGFTFYNKYLKSDMKVAEINVTQNSDELESDATINKKTAILLVNRDNTLSENFYPNDLVIPNIPFKDDSNNEERHISKSISKPLEDLFEAAQAEGIILFGNSGYRSFASQKELYDEKVLNMGQEMADAYVAKAGFSEHQTGLCIDLTNSSNYFAKGVLEADWLVSNAHKFGFIIRYPEGTKDITGIAYEPWHIRYVGDEAAQEIFDDNLTLEEYLN